MRRQLAVTGRGGLKKATNLAPLRQRPDLQKLLAELESKQPAPPEPKPQSPKK